MDTKAAQAMIRFGLGRRPDESVPADPVGWLRAQVQMRDTASFPELMDSGRCMAAWRDDTLHPLPPGQGTRVQAILQAEKLAAIRYAIATDAPFRERLVWFWTNHFTVSVSRLEVWPVLGAYIREAIRPHVTGRFEDMLMAVMRHPAMLMYLDNAGSVGPNSPLGRSDGEGLNENLGRECMELHTLSPASGYTQTDVTSFSKLITGWTVDYGAPEPGFVFNPNSHEPGPQTVMGVVYPPGEAGGIAALKAFAAHPATHQFLATKLVRHFTADMPHPSDVAHVAGVLRDTDGDLGAAALAVVELESAWRPFTKLRDPQCYVIACMRAFDLPVEKRPNLHDTLAGLGQPLWAAPLPNGWSDRAADWAGPEALLRRAEWVNGVAAQAPDIDPVEMAQATLGDLIQPDTLQAIKFAGSRRAAMTMLMASPEFMRR
jgi:uncharacterized protein (DUF1800 family)